MPILVNKIRNIYCISVCISKISGLKTLILFSLDYWVSLELFREKPNYLDSFNKIIRIFGLVSFAETVSELSKIVKESIKFFMVYCLGFFKFFAKII